MRDNDVIIEAECTMERLELLLYIVVYVFHADKMRLESGSVYLLPNSFFFYNNSSENN